MEERESFTPLLPQPSLLHAFNDGAVVGCSQSRFRYASVEVRLEIITRCHVPEGTWNKNNDRETTARPRNRGSP